MHYGEAEVSHLFATTFFYTDMYICVFTPPVVAVIPKPATENYIKAFCTKFQAGYCNKVNLSLRHKRQKIGVEV
jgi:hypothetical protein